MMTERQNQAWKAQTDISTFLPLHSGETVGSTTSEEHLYRGNFFFFLAVVSMKLETALLKIMGTC